MVGYYALLLNYGQQSFSKFIATRVLKNKMRKKALHLFHYKSVSSARMYSPKSAWKNWEKIKSADIICVNLHIRFYTWWNATMFMGSACLHSEVAFAATPNPMGKSAMLCTITPWYLRRAKNWGIKCSKLLTLECSPWSCPTHFSWYDAHTGTAALQKLSPRSERKVLTYSVAQCKMHNLSRQPLV